MPYTQIDDIKIFYTVVGNDENLSNKLTLLFLHGGAGIADHSIYVPFWSKLSNILNVIFIDQRGCGKTEKGDPKKWNIDQHGKDVYSFCQALGISKPIVGGVSWGGYVAISYASQYPSHPLALILCNSEAKVSPKERYKAFLRVGGKEAAEAVKAFDTYWNETTNADYFKKCLPFYAKNPYTTEELAQCIRNPEMFAKFIKEEHTSFNLIPALKKIQCPVLHLAGDNDPVHPVASAQETAAHLGDLSELVIIKNTGDPVYRDQPEETLKVITTFIHKLMTNQTLQ